MFVTMPTRSDISMPTRSDISKRISSTRRRMRYASDRCCSTLLSEGVFGDDCDPLFAAILAAG